MTGRTNYIARGIAVADRTVIAPHQSAIDTTATHAARSVAVSNRSLVSSYQPADLNSTAHAATDHPYVSDRRTCACPSKKTDIICCRTIDGEAGNGVPQPVERAGELGGCIADWRKARPRIPRGRCRRVDVAAQRVVKRQSAIHALQIRGRNAVRRTEAGDDGEVFNGARRAELGAEVVSGGKVDGGVDVVNAGAAPCRDLPVFQRETGAAGAVQVGVDVDVVLGVEGELVGRPGDDVVDVDVAQCAGGAAGAPDGDVAPAEVGREGCAGHVAAGGGDGEVERVDQPGARET